MESSSRLSIGLQVLSWQQGFNSCITPLCIFPCSLLRTSKFRVGAGVQDSEWTDDPPKTYPDCKATSSKRRVH